MIIKSKSIFEFEKNQKSIVGKISRRGKPFTCPICQNTIIRQFKNDVVLDHSHKDGQIRGWICRQCNSSLGMMDEDINILKIARTGEFIRLLGVKGE